MRPTTNLIAILSAMLAPSAALADGPISLCDRNACLVTHSDKDSDGDGVSDADELAAGTDPNDPGSRPRLRQLLDLIRMDQLPSFLDQHAFVVVLPTVTPNGKPVLGGLAALPARARTLDALGIDARGIDDAQLANGLAIGPGGTAPGAQPLRIGAIQTATISAGAAPTVPPATALARALAAAGAPCCGTIDGAVANVGRAAGTTFGTIQLPNASQVSWARDDLGNYQVGAEARDGKELLGRAGSARGSSSPPEGGTLDSFGETREDPRGGISDVWWDRHELDLDVTVEYSSCKGQSCASYEATVPADPKEPDPGQDPGEPDPDAPVGDDTTAFIAPDDTSYDPMIGRRGVGVVPTDLFAIVVAIHGGNVTYGDPPAAADGGEPVATTPDGPLVIHVDDDPTGFGGVGFGIGLPRVLPEPRIDPSLPNPLSGGATPKPRDCRRAGTC